MHLAFARAAQGDLDDIIAWIMQDNPAAAQKVAQAIVTTTQRLCDFPQMGRTGYLAGTREFVVPGLSYVIVYQVTADTLTVLAVFHGARDLVRALAERQQGE